MSILAELKPRQFQNNKLHTIPSFKKSLITGTLQSIEQNDEGFLNIEELFSDENIDSAGPSKGNFQSTSSNGMKVTKTVQVHKRKLNDNIKAEAEKIISAAESLLTLVSSVETNSEPLSEKERRLELWEAELSLKAETLKLERDIFETEKNEWEISKNELVNGIVSVSGQDSSITTNQIVEDLEVSSSHQDIQVTTSILSDNSAINPNIDIVSEKNLKTVNQENLSRQKKSDLKHEKDLKSRKRKLSENDKRPPKRAAAIEATKLF